MSRRSNLSQSPSTHHRGPTLEIGADPTETSGLSRVVPHLIAGASLVLVLLASAVSWRAIEQASLDLGPMTAAILSWIHGRTALGATALLLALVAASIRQPRPPTRSAWFLAIGSTVAAFAGAMVSAPVAMAVGACAALLLLLVWFRRGLWVSLPLGVAGASLAAVSYSLPYNPGDPIPPLAAPFLGLSIALAGGAAIAATRAAGPTVLVLWLGTALAGVRLDPWPVMETSGVALPEAIDGLEVRDVGQHHAVVVEADGTTRGLPVPDDRLKDVRLDIDADAMGSDILPILDTLRQAGAKNLDLRLTDPPQDATVPTRHIRVMQVSLMAREGFPLSLKVHPEVSLNNRAMPLEGASIELQRRLRSSFPKTARVVVSPEATWQGVVEAADVVRQAGGTVLLVGEGTP